MVQLILERGATVNAFDKKDRRAIHWAAFMGHVEIVQLLIDFGAEVNCRDKEVCLSWLFILLLFLCRIAFTQNIICFCKVVYADCCTNLKCSEHIKFNDYILFNL